MTDSIPVTVSFGDGIGPDIMTATLNVLRYARAPLRIHTVEIGRRAYHHGFRYGIPASCMDKIMEYKVLLHAPIGPPPAPEYESLNLAAYLQCDRTSMRQFDTTSLYIPKHSSMQAVAHVGEHYAFFEPAHGPCPELADQDIANPTGMILAAILMLEHLKLFTCAHAIQQALHHTLKDGCRTKDMAGSFSHVGTTAFSEAIISRL